MHFFKCLPAALLVLLLGAAHAAAANVFDIPGGLDKSVTPQFILFTHDDGTNADSAKYVTAVTNKHKNPNGCNINAAFFTTVFDSDCAAVKKLYLQGHEIAEHSVKHLDLHNMSYTAKKKDITTARNWIIKCGVPATEVIGHRSPMLSDDSQVRSILATSGFKYDSSILEVYNSPSSPSAARRLWPYSMGSGIKQLFSCAWFNNINHCTSTEKPKLSQIPMWIAQKGDGTASTPCCSQDLPNAYANYKEWFDANRKGNKAPVGIFVHSTATGYLVKQKNRDEISKFLTYALAKPGTWVVTPRQLLDWVKAPVPISKMSSFMAKYKCYKA